MLALALVLAATPVVESYEKARAELEAKRVEIATVWKKAPKKARTDARKALVAYLDDSAFPAWKGTPWEFYGTSTTPGEGTIACGYFVTTVLEQAGFKIERVWLAQQASAVLVNTLAHGTKVDWLHPADNADAVKQISERFKDAELVVIGFDFHVGLLRLDHQKNEARFCHSSYLEPASVTCEDPVPAGAFASKLYVVGDALNDALLDDWINGKAVQRARRN
ncbi:MAG: hypothetical protein QM817_16380 [Archangium sp.]